MYACPWDSENSNTIAQWDLECNHPSIMAVTWQRVIRMCESSALTPSFIHAIEFSCNVLSRKSFDDSVVQLIFKRVSVSMREKYLRIS